MKPKQIITYIKNEEEITKTINPFNKRTIIKTIFNDPFYQLNSFDWYEINEDIKKIHLKNVTFYRGIKFHCPKNTLLILEDCLFKGNMLHFIGGNIKLIRPILPVEYFSNYISGTNLEECNIIIDDQNTNYLNINLDSKKIYLDAGKRARNLYLNGKEIIIKNITKLKRLTIKGTNFIKSIDNTIEVDNYNQSEQKEMPEIITPTLILENSSIKSCGSLKIFSDNISLDEYSNFKSDYEIYLNNYTCKNAHSPTKELILNKAFLNYLTKIIPSNDIIEEKTSSLIESPKTKKRIKKL